MLKRLYNRIYQDFLSKPVPQSSLQPATNDEAALIDKLRSEIKDIPPEPVEGVSPAAKAWNEWMNNFRNLVLTKDPREFLTWDVIVGTMFVKSEPYINYEFKQLKKDQNSKWLKATAESTVGQPTRYYRFGNSSGNLVHHVFHVNQFELATGVEVSNMDFVLEFGGGYGSMCRLFQNIGFKGKYVIFDLPAFSALQRYYLKSIGYKVLNKDEFNSSTSGILCVSDLQELQDIVNTSVDAKVKSLFIATWSLSETPVEFRGTFIPVLKNFSYFLIAYQHQFRDVNNIEYFKTFAQGYSNTLWRNRVISHMKVHDYLIGRPKANL